MENGLAALIAKYQAETETERAAHRDALALCAHYEQRIADAGDIMTDLLTMVAAFGGKEGETARPIVDRAFEWLNGNGGMK